MTKRTKGIRILPGHSYHAKTDDQIRYIIRDAGEAALAMRHHDPVAEGKYLDQCSDARSILRARQPEWRL